MTSKQQLADFLDHLSAAFARGEYPDDAVHTRRLRLREAATALRIPVETSVTNERALALEALALNVLSSEEQCANLILRRFPKGCGECLYCQAAELMEPCGDPHTSPHSEQIKCLLPKGHDGDHHNDRWSWRLKSSENGS